MPLHLTLAGSASVAISGAMQTFAPALTATESPPPWLSGAQLGLVNAGALFIAAGYPLGRPGLVTLGGIGFVAGAALLGLFVWRAWRHAFNRRHRLPVLLYGSAVTCVFVGGTLGALIGSRAIHSAVESVALRRAHMSLNVLGWVSLTIAGTLITLLPTVLRVRMPEWRGKATAGLLVAGVALVSTGFAARLSALTAVGGIGYAFGALGLAWMVAKVIAMPRNWPAPIAAKHIVLAVGWFVFGSVALAVTLVRGEAAFDSFRPVFLVTFVGGWIVQTLLGAWLFLLPNWRPGHPEDRRLSFSAVELGGRLQLVALNAGLVIMALRGSTPHPGAAGAIGTGLALAGAGVALVKAWAFPLLAGRRFVALRARRTWG